MKNKRIKAGEIFEVKSMVTRSGTYVCVPCGYKKKFKTGESFPLCFSCLKGKKYKGKDYIEGLGLWELLEND